MLIAAGAGTGVLGCLFAPLLILLLLLGVLVMCAIGWILWPVVLLCEIGILPCGGGGGGGGGGVDSSVIVDAFNSDGLGELNTEAVPSKYREVIEKAGGECAQIGAIVIVSQVQYESGFVENLVGPDGAKGLSQLPPDKFEEYGEDEDDNDETSALDGEDSIMAQARYMCALAKDIDALLASGEVEGDRLDLTLAAYDAGLDAVKQAKGVPETPRSQTYIIGVRSSFALYSEGAALSDEEYPSLSPRPTPSD
ncbi:transglycosylase SLT domain-containing protein [Streptomyces flavalbus]|uniref:Transglycosylase SLT domain-containing protein n=1 Tax=Streptomyces flavalbus TaxID=2665155 RepID=A0ABW2WAB1_9ACTN